MKKVLVLTIIGALISSCVWAQQGVNMNNMNPAVIDNIYSNDPFVSPKFNSASDAVVGKAAIAMVMNSGGDVAQAAILDSYFINELEITRPQRDAATAQAEILRTDYQTLRNNVLDIQLDSDATGEKVKLGDYQKTLQSMYGNTLTDEQLIEAISADENLEDYLS